MKGSIGKFVGRRPTPATLWLLGTTAAAFAAWSAAAIATPINLVVGGSWIVSPGTTGTITLSAVNVNNGTSVSTFNGWAVGVQLLPSVGATGSATFGEFAYSPVSNPSLLDADPSTDMTPSTLDTITNGTLDYFLLALGNNSALSTTWSSGQSYNLISVPVTMSANASGTWTLYAVSNQYGISGWTTPTGSFNTWGNLVDQEASSLTLGTLMTMAPVPEPETLALVSMAAATLGGMGLFRRRRRRTVA